METEPRMDPDDPRHGTTRGHNAGCRCQPCSAAKLAYDKRRKLEATKGASRRVEGWRMTRRVQALQALGWSLRAIGTEAGFKHHNYCNRQRHYVNIATFRMLDAAYNRLSMRLPPTNTVDQRIKVTRVINHARRNRYAPPLAWNNIDDPNETPDFGSNKKRDDRYDEAVVIRLLSGENIPCRTADKIEALRRWVQKGGTAREFCRIKGWKENRYPLGDTRKSEDAA